MVHPFAILMDGGVRIAIISDGIIVPVIIDLVSTVTRRVVAVVLESAVTSVSHWVVVVGSVRLDGTVLLGHNSVGLISGGATVLSQFQLPQRILRVDGSSIIGIGIAVLSVSHIDP